MEMDYYAYEYSVIMNLMEYFKIESIQFYKDREEVKGLIRNKIGKLESRTLAVYDNNDSIILNFKKDFHFTIRRDIIKNSFENNVDIEYIVKDCIYDIEHEWLKEIKYE